MGKKRGNAGLQIILSVASVIVFALFFWVAQPSYSSEKIDSPHGRYALWIDIEKAAAKGDLSPEFIYAICVAESSLNPRANSGYARGLMQLSRVAWKEVSHRPYSQAYNPQTNLQVGVAYLNFLKEKLEAADKFSYARLAAAYRYGPYKLQDEGYNINRLPKPENLIYQRLFDGEVDPVLPPQPPEKPAAAS